MDFTLTGLDPVKEKAVIYSDKILKVFKAEGKP